jgi:uncharacterized protein YcfJ
MKPISLSVLALAISVAAGSAVAYQQDYNYANDPGYYDSRDRTDYNNGNFISSHPRRDTAQVIRVERFNDSYSDNGGYQRQECWDEQTNSYEGGYYRDSQGRLYHSDSNHHDSNVNGTIIGAIIGGALGNQVGKGDGKTAATIGGAVIGGAVGNNIDRNNNNDSYDQYRDNSGTIRRCRLINDNSGDSRYGGNGGYNVTYRYAGQTYHAYTRRDPGRYIRVLVDVRPQEDGYDNRR